MLEYEFMRHAFAAAALTAIVSGVVGYFLVLRGEAFAAHALAHVGFSGATGAALLGVGPLWGQMAITVIAAIGMGLGGERLIRRDVVVGIVLAFSLGLGLLFLHFFTAYATQVTALLFGNVLAVDSTTMRSLLLTGAFSLAALALISRPLLFASLHPETAEAKGVPLRRYSVLFLIIVALATAQCAQIVGVLLVFSLMIGPAAAAQEMTSSAATGILLSALLALSLAWLGITLAYYTDWPSSFWIAALSASTYLLAAATRKSRRHMRVPLSGVGSTDIEASGND